MKVSCRLLLVLEVVVHVIQGRILEENVIIVIDGDTVLSNLYGFLNGNGVLHGGNKTNVNDPYVDPLMGSQVVLMSGIYDQTGVYSVLVITV